MRPFRFRLQTVLRVRELREREALRRVAGKRSEIARLDALDEAARAEIAREQQRLRVEGGALDMAGAARGRAWVAHLRREMLERERHRQRLHTELAALWQGWRQARTDARSLQKLREKRKLEHGQLAARREQVDADEMARQLHMTRGTEAGLA